MECRVFPPSLRSLGDIIGHSEKLLGLFVKKQMIIAEMATAHMPMEVLRFQIKRKHIGKQTAEIAGDFLDTVTNKIGRRLEIADSGLAGNNCLLAHCSLLLRLKLSRRPVIACRLPSVSEDSLDRTARQPPLLIRRSR